MQVEELHLSGCMLWRELFLQMCLEMASTGGRDGRSGQVEEIICGCSGGGRLSSASETYGLFGLRIHGG